MIKLLTFDDLFPPLRLLKLLVELRRLSRFATKMTLVHGSWAVLSIEKISYSKSSSSQNLKLSIIDTSLYAGTIVPRSNLYWVTRKIELPFASDQWPSLQNTSCIRKPQFISGGGAHPLHPPPRSAPSFQWASEYIFLSPPTINYFTFYTRHLRSNIR